MSRYFVSFVISLLLYLPLFYLLFFYAPEEKEKIEHIPINISAFQTKEPAAKPKPKALPKKQKPKKLPKALYPNPQKVVEKLIPTPAKDVKKKPKKKKLEQKKKQEEKKEDENQTAFVKATPLTIDELNSLFDKNKEEKKEAKEPVKNKPKKKELLTPEEKKLIDLYGDEFDSLTSDEKEYLKENINSIGLITQKYLKYPYLAARLGMNGKNMVEFYLDEKGNISDLKLIDTSGYTLLDDNSIETVELAHKDYPYPKKRTRIRIYVDYILN